MAAMADHHTPVANYLPAATPVTNPAVAAFDDFVDPAPPAAAGAWSGGVRLVLDCPLAAAWAVQSDFLGLHKWVPSISVCAHLGGPPAPERGCLRYCKGSGATWVQERLLAIDRATHRMRYRMEHNRFMFRDGFRNYVADVQLRDAGEGKTLVEWTYTVDPVATQTHETLAEFMTHFYTANLRYLETAAKKAASTPAAAVTNEGILEPPAHTFSPARNPVAV